MRLPKPIHWLYVLYALILFVVLMLPVFAWSLIALVFGRIRGGNLVYYGCMAWADAWFFLIGIRHRNIYLEKPPAGSSSIFVANHISYLDSAIIPKAFRQPVRPLGKAEMARIPIFGFIYRHAIVTVDRSSPQNRSRSVRELKMMLQRGISVLVFPEGTFNTTHQPLKAFYDGAFRLAVETGAPVRPVLLLDAYDRMHYRTIFSLNPGRSRAIFLPAIHVEEGGAALLKAKVFAAMEEALVAYGASWIRK